MTITHPRVRPVKCNKNWRMKGENNIHNVYSVASNEPFTGINLSDSKFHTCFTDEETEV